jgi:hypothetical protein
MALSQNRWPVITDDAHLARLTVRGVDFPAGVRADVKPLLADLVTRLADIERIRDGWCWGYAYRPIRGRSSGFSNHASGTAIDYNAPIHPRQSSSRHAGWTADQVTAVRRLLRRYDGAIRWGGDYDSAPYDPMHFEIVGGRDHVLRVIARLAGGLAYPGTPLKLGSRGPAVTTWQKGMNAKRGWSLAVDGAFGPACDHAARTLQRNHGLHVDGVVGPATWEVTFS